MLIKIADLNSNASSSLTRWHATNISRPSLHEMVLKSTLSLSMYRAKRSGMISDKGCMWTRIRADEDDRSIAWMRKGWKLVIQNMQVSPMVGMRQQQLIQVQNQNFISLGLNEKLNSRPQKGNIPLASTNQRLGGGAWFGGAYPG